MASVTEERLAQVNPVLARHVERLIIRLADSGVAIRVVQGLRSWNEQQALYDKGRTVPGEPCLHAGITRPVGSCEIHPRGSIVTRCLPGHSWHNFGLAVDVAPDDPKLLGYQPNWNQSHPSWQQIHKSAREMGFVCGADFRTFPDLPHLQMTGRFPVSPNGEVRQLFTDGGICAVWDEARLGA